MADKAELMIYTRNTFKTVKSDLRFEPAPRIDSDDFYRLVQRYCDAVSVLPLEKADFEK